MLRHLSVSALAAAASTEQCREQEVLLLVQVESVVSCPSLSGWA